MKKILALLLSVILTLSVLGISASAETVDEQDEAAPEVFVTVADEQGKTVLAAQQVAVTDIDNDGALTINDALFAAHEKFYDGGAEAGYATSVTQYGLGITKLWGSTIGSYGYYVNNISAWSLADTVKDGDYVAAFVYTDPYWSDHYSYFESFSGLVTPGEEIALTYKESAYDENWNPVELPVEGAVITVDGEQTEMTTDAEGKAVISLSDEGVHIVSAAKEGRILVAPVFVATVVKAVKGDADGDGEVTILDATRIQRCIAELEPANNISMKNAEADGDGMVTILDATRIQRLIAELIDEL